MACPSGKFAEQVQTTSGLTPDSPYTLVPNYIAYGEWLAQAQAVLSRTRREYKNYTDFKPAEDWTPEQTATWTTLGNEFDALVERYNDLPHPWDLLDSAFPSELITRAVHLLTDIACLWERITADTAALGGKPIDVPGDLPKAGMTLLDKALLIGGLAIGGVVIVSVARIASKKAYG